MGGGLAANDRLTDHTYRITSHFFYSAFSFPALPPVAASAAFMLAWALVRAAYTPAATASASPPVCGGSSTKTRAMMRYVCGSRRPEGRFMCALGTTWRGEALAVGLGGGKRITAEIC